MPGDVDSDKRTSVVKTYKVIFKISIGITSNVNFFATNELCVQNFCIQLMLNVAKAVAISSYMAIFETSLTCIIL